MDEQRFSKENNEEQQKQAIQEEHILKHKRHSPATASQKSGRKTSGITSMACRFSVPSKTKANEQKAQF